MRHSPPSREIKRNPFSSQRQRDKKIGDVTPYSTSDKNSEALKLLNTEKFIQQNNFIPVPAMVLANIGNSGSHSPAPQDNMRLFMNMTSPNFYESGEHLTQERFVKSRQQAKRTKIMGFNN